MEQEDATFFLIKREWIKSMGTLTYGKLNP